MADAKRTASAHSLDEAAAEYGRLGLRIIPLRGKVPAVRDPFHFCLNASSLRYFFAAQGCNIGVLTGDFVVLDSDNDQAEAWIRKKGIESSMVVRSGGGGLHRYFDGRGLHVRNRQGLHGVHGLDVRGHGGFIVFPPSVHPDSGERYQFVTQLLPLDGLPPFRPEWINEERSAPYGLRRIAVSLRSPLKGRDIESVRRSIRRTVAVSGAGGHDATFAVACELAEAGLTYDAALAELLAWNETNAVPRWSERELMHKVQDAFEKVHGR
jgi:Bifunctional DNA primase/polymerase, N-terminal